MTSGIRRTNKEVKEILDGLGYEFIDEYIGKHGKRKVIIKDFNGYKYDVVLNNIKRYSPSMVGKNNPFSLENISLWLYKNKKSFLLLEDNIYRGNREKLYFLCSVCSENFNSKWTFIYDSGYGCPYCSGKRVSDKNRLSILYPELISEWHPTKNGDLTPDDVSYGSNRVAWWICKDNHEWQMGTSTRTNGKQGCPCCAGNIVSDKNRLSTLYPKVSSEWHPTKNGDLTPDNVSYGSNSSVWWMCGSGHEWKSKILNRTLSESGCPECNLSKGEKRVALFLKEYGVSYIPQQKFQECKHKKALPFDFYLPDFNFLIEYQGTQHYQPIDFIGKGQKWAEDQFKEIQKRDKIKEKYCKDNNIPLLIIPYWDYDNIEQILTETLQLA